MRNDFKVLSLTNADLFAIDESVAEANGIEPLSEKELAEWCEWIKVDPNKTYDVVQPDRCAAKQALFVGTELNGRLFEIIYVKDTYALNYQCCGHEYVREGRLLFAYAPDKLSRFSEIWIRMVIPPTNRYETRFHI